MGYSLRRQIKLHWVERHQRDNDCKIRKARIEDEAN